MEQVYVLYNSKAGEGACEEDAHILDLIYDHAIYYDMNGITDYENFLSELDDEDSIVLCGGDGTINWFVNRTSKLCIKNPIYLYALGLQNNFAKALGKERWEAPFGPVNVYLENATQVMVLGKKYHFINSVGHFDRKANAVVWVDGQKHIYKNIWKLTVTNDQTAAPEQNDLRNEVRLVVEKDSEWAWRLFKGKYNKHVKVLSGRDIRIKLDRPVVIQMDGEQIINVKKYRIVK